MIRSVTILQVGDTFIITPIKPFSKKLFLEECDTVVKKLGEEYEYPTNNRDTVLSHVRRLFAKNETPQTETP